MNRAAQYLVTIVLCAAMTPLLRSRTASDDGHPKHSPDAALIWSSSSDAREGKWEHDPIVFSPRDRSSIRNYYRGAPSNLPPGLAKRNGNLPPGLKAERHAASRIAEAASTASTRRRTPQALDSGYSRGMIGQDVVIVEDRTQRIMDIIRDVTARH